MQVKAPSNRFSSAHFSQIPSVNQARSVFDRSFTNKTTFNFDYITPCLVDEIIPGDTMNVKTSAFARLATQVVPLMDNAYIDFFFFFVPMRLVWQHWEQFCGYQANPGDSTSFAIPTLASFAVNSPASSTVFDYFGLPCNVAAGYGGVNALPFRCLNLIFNDWFRDQNVDNSMTVETDDGPDPLSQYFLPFRNKRHDFATSSLPAPQRGPALTIPMAGYATVIPGGAGYPTFTGAGLSGTPLGINTGDAHAAWNATPVGTSSPASWANPNLQASLTTATGATIDALIQAFQLQSLLSLDARGGTRYTEILLNHYGVVSPDFRLQRPEYLGGGSVTIASNPVAQTAPTSGSNYQAQLASFGTAGGSGIGFSHSFVEHGYVIGLMSARGDTTYQQGLDKFWSRSTRFDFFWPKLQQIGEAAVLNQELYCQGTGADTGVFGYNERYYEYRYKQSRIGGEFNSTYSAPLDQWHLAQHFLSLPALNSSFMQNNTPIVRNLASSTAPHLMIDLFFKITHARPMLAYSVPAHLGRF